MKIAHRVCVVGFLAASALLTVALLTACLNPIAFTFPADIPEDLSAGVTSPSSKTIQGVQDTTPFTLNVWVDDAARSAAGMDTDRITQNSDAENNWSGIRNIIHLVVVDAEGKVADFKEVVKRSDNHETVTLVVTGLTYGSTYKFLLLTGHKERDYAAPGYAYQNKAPTLLAAGFTSTSVSRGQKISIDMYPVVVETTFTGGGTTVEAELGDTLLDAGSWEIVWKAAGLQALKAAAPNGGTIFTEARTLVQGEAITDAEVILSSPPAVNDQGVMQISRDVSAYTGMDQAGKQHSASFNVDYAPFHLPQAAWNGRNPPVWIIRNGVNDKPQDAHTDFARGVSWTAVVNGNGAVNFAVGSASYYVKDTGDDRWAGTPSTPFKTLAHAYTAALANPSKTTITVLSDLDLNADEAMELSGPPAGDAITITSAGAVADGPWTLARSEGSDQDAVVKVSNGAKVVFSNITIDGKNNPGNGSMRNRALYIEGAATKVTLDQTHLVGKVTEPDSGGGGAVYIQSGELIMNDGSTITGEAVDFLSEEAFYGGGVYLESGTFTMNGGIVSGKAVFGGGVYVAGGTFTMNDGEISNSTSPFLLYAVGPYGGGGVFVAAGKFHMKGGEISNNHADEHGSGGGVYVADGGEFTMEEDAIIRDNTTDGEGGGVHNRGEFRMKGGEISGNQAQGNGGGVYNNKTFTMEDGTISRNRTNGFGGGVYNNKTFTMEDGTISGNHAVVAGGGVFTNGTFMMNSGVIYGQEDDEPPEDWMNNSADEGGGSAYADAALGTSADYTINQYPEEEP